MDVAFQDILARARMLPDSEKENLARLLLEDVGEDWDTVIRSAWVKEAERRFDAYRRGEMTDAPIDEAIQRVRTKLSL